MNKAKVLVITGSVGVGKSSVADSISEILRKKGEKHAVIDMDYLRYVYPRPKADPFSRELATKNLKSVWKNYQLLGIKTVIVSNVVEHAADVEDIVKAMPDTEITVVQLTADLDTIHERLRERHRKRDQENLAWHIGRAKELTVKLEDSGVEDFVVDTNKKLPAEVANEILSKWA